MAITKRSCTNGWVYTTAPEPEDLYVGRVIEVRRYSDSRNMSDTMDYSDWRTVDCCDALVWLGEEGHPGGHEWNPRRPLEFHEQFMWVDCSNHFSDRVGFVLIPEVDADPRKGGDPLMWVNLIAWRSHQDGIHREKVLQKEAIEAERRKALDAQRAADEARAKKLEEGKATAESLLRIYAPAKGAVVTLPSVTGTVFWTGVKMYRGAWRSTVGVKDKYGTAHWIDIGQFMPPVEKRVGRKRKVSP